MTSYNEDSNKGHVLEVDVEYIERLREFHNDLPFSHWKSENCEAWKTCSQLAWLKIVIHIKNLKQALAQAQISIEKSA